MSIMNVGTSGKARLISWKSEIQQLLIIAVAFSCLLLMARVFYTGKITFCFLVWNLFLGTIPYFTSTWLTENRSRIGKKWKLILPGMIWLLFIPNSFYILTDLFHLHDSHLVPQWYDLLLILSFAWNGLLLGILSVRQIEKLMENILPPNLRWVFIYSIMWLNALGIYIGRYMRFNSWDIISNPFHLLRDIVWVIVHPLHSLGAWGMIFSFSFFLTIFYAVIKKLGKSIE